MHKPSPRISIISAIAAAMGASVLPRLEKESTAQIFKAHRGPAPRGMRYITGVYVPGGPNPNTNGTPVKNPKQAAQMQAMHDAWCVQKFGPRPIKYELEANKSAYFMAEDGMKEITETGEVRPLSYNATVDE